MSESTRKRMVYGLLAGAVVFGLVMKPWESSRRPRGSKPDDQQPPPPAAAAVASIIGEPHRTVFVAEWPRDPFATPEGKSQAIMPGINNAPATPSGVWMLQGILTVDGERTCVLDGQVLLPGDELDGWSVEYIGQNEILLVRAAETKRLVLP